MEPEEGKGTVRLFGAHVSSDKERKIILASAVLGIIGFAYIVLKNRSGGAPTSTGPASSNQTAGTGGSSGSGGSGGSGGGGAGTTAQPLPDIELKFSESTSPSFEYESGGSKSGGGSLSFGPFSIGGGGSSNSSKHAKLGVENVFSADTVIHGADAGTLQAVMTWLQGLAGTQAERASQATNELNQLYPIINPGHTIEGVVAHEQAQQALEDAKNAAAIAKLNRRPGDGHSRGNPILNSIRPIMRPASTSPLFARPYLDIHRIGKDTSVLAGGGSFVR